MSLKSLAELCGVNDYKDSESRETLLISTAQRWCQENSPYELEVVPESENLEILMDQFIDKHLHELPIPRFSTTKVPEIYNDLRYCVLIAAKRNGLNIDDCELKDEENLGTLYKCFKALYPHLDILRDSKISKENQAMLIILMALDPVNLRRIDIKSINDVDFKERSLRFLKEETGFELKTPIEALKIMNTHINTIDIQDARALLPKAEADWTSWSYLFDMKLVSKEQIDEVEQEIDEHAYCTGLSKETLTKMCCIKSIIDEILIIGFRS